MLPLPPSLTPTKSRASFERDFRSATSGGHNRHEPDGRGQWVGYTNLRSSGRGSFSLEVMTSLGSDPKCSFCGMPSSQVERMLAGQEGAYICNECVDMCHGFLHGDEWKTQIVFKEARPGSQSP
jgi:hypothetical protein